VIARASHREMELEEAKSFFEPDQERPDLT